MKILDLDMDYFMNYVATNIPDSTEDRLSDEYDNTVWSKDEVIYFLEHNLGLNKQNKIPGRIVKGHNESLFFWQELITKGLLDERFEVIHVDSHADLGLGYASWAYIYKELLKYPVSMRPKYAECDLCGKKKRETIGDYLLFAIAYRMISSLTYCGNPSTQCNDYIKYTLKDFKENQKSQNDPIIHNTIQLLYNRNSFPFGYGDAAYRQYINDSVKEPEIPFNIISKMEDVHFSDFNFAVMAHSPNYTPKSADFILSVFREYIIEL